MKNHFPLLFLVFAIAAFSAAAHASGDCADELGCVEIGPEENIVFGGILRLSGPRPWTGEVARNAFHLALLERGRDVCLSVKSSWCLRTAPAPRRRRGKRRDERSRILQSSASSAPIARLRQKAPCQSSAKRASS